MASAVDLSTFKPTGVGDLASGIFSQLAGLLVGKFERFRQEYLSYVEDVSRATIAVANQLKDGLYDVRQADLALHAQELLISNAILRAEFLTYELAQSVLETIFTVLRAAIRNLTGVDLRF